MKYGGKSPRIAKDCFVADTATIVGDVDIGTGSSIWFSSSVRAESERIQIGFRSNIQDNCSVHTDAGFRCEIGDNVSVGHGAIVHGSHIGSNCLIGMGSIILNGSRIGSNSIIGAGSLVVQGTEIPENTLALGSPAKVKRSVTDEEIEKISENALHYYEFRAGYLSIKNPL
jgi:carbonic anhydrase/acetyltransferase-like protein (isoleucine patch superfamily)